MSLGQNVSKHRKARGWTQKEFADQIGIHQAHVTRIENDRLQPGKATLAKICETFEISIAELYASSSPQSAPILQDSVMLNAFQMAQELNPDDKEVVLRVVQALLTKNKMEQFLQWPSQHRQAS